MTADNKEMLFNAHEEGKWEVVEFLLNQMDVEVYPKNDKKFLSLFCDILKLEKTKCKQILIEKKLDIRTTFDYNELLPLFRDDYTLLNDFFILSSFKNTLLVHSKALGLINMFVHLIGLFPEEFNEAQINAAFTKSKEFTHSLLDLGFFPRVSFTGSLEHIQDYFNNEEKVVKLVVHNQLDLYKKLNIKLSDERYRDGLLDTCLEYERTDFFKILWNLNKEEDKIKKYLRNCVGNGNNYSIVEFLLSLYENKESFILNILTNYEEVDTAMNCFLVDHLSNRLDGKNVEILWRKFRLNKEVLNHLYRKSFIPNLDMLEPLLKFKDNNIILLKTLHENGYHMHLQCDALLRFIDYDLESIKFLVSIGLDPSMVYGAKSAINDTKIAEIKEYYESLIPSQNLFFGFKFDDEINKEFKILECEHSGQRYYGYFLTKKIGCYTYDSEDIYYMDRVKNLAKLLNVNPNFYLF